MVLNMLKGSASWSAMIGTASRKEVCKYKHMVENLDGKADKLEGEARHHALRDYSAAQDQLALAYKAKADHEEAVEIQTAELEHQVMFQATDVEAFSAQVEVQLGKRCHNSSTKEHRCPTCYKRFDTKWQLNDHLRFAHDADTNRVII